MERNSETVTMDESWRWYFPDSPPDGADDELAVAALIAVLGITPGARGLWRAWCVDLAESGPDGAAEPVYVVEAEPAGATALAESLRAAARGGDSARIEVVAAGEDASDFQRTARSYGELLWAAEPAPVITVARTFDYVLADGRPSFAPDHPTIADGPERTRVLTYLRAGTTLLTTPTTMEDVVDPSRGSVVSANFRTDGTWIWPDTVEYYLDVHGLAPDARLLAHVHAGEGLPPRLDSVAVHRAMAELYRPR